MLTLLEPGMTVRLRRFPDVRCVVGPLIGAGGQGEVYRAQVSSRSGADEVALKWYYPSSNTAEQLDVLEELTAAAPPHPSFLWPVDIAETNRPGFGYVMPLRDPRFSQAADLMARRVEMSFRNTVTAGANLTNAFLCLHSQGLCYRDISFGNVFVDATNGEVLVVDNDNVGIDGRAADSIRGTDRFMAPEIVRGEAHPSTVTDLYSLSVLLFYLLMLSHPLDGRREAELPVLDRAANEMLYGAHPLFIFDPVDTSNAPLPGAHDNALVFWPLYPQWFRDLFVRAFTSGLRDPRNGRVREGEWRAALSTLREHIVECPPCGAEVFWDQLSGADAECWHCRQAVPTPPRLALQSGVGRDVVLLTRRTSLFAHHLRSGAWGWTSPLATVVAHPELPGVFGLENRSDVGWDVTTAEGDRAHVPPGRRVRIADGVTIDFGRVRGTVST